MIDWTKPIQTRDGRKAEFVRKVREVYWVVLGEGPSEVMVFYPQSGRVPEAFERFNDIVNVPEEVVLGVVNVYENGWPILHYDRSKADTCKDAHRTHVVTITRCGDEVTATVEKVQ